MQEMIISFVASRNDGSYWVHPLHIDAGPALSHWHSFKNWKALLKTMRYLGATKDQIACFEEHRRGSGSGNVQIHLLPKRKNLLDIDYSKLVTQYVGSGEARGTQGPSADSKADKVVYKR
jgi:hypothetical protein